GQRAAAEVWITAAHQNQIAIQPPALVHSGLGFHGGVKAIVGADERQGGGGGEQLGVGSRREQFFGVVFVERFPAAERDNLDAPEAAGDVRLRQDAIDLPR